MDGTVHIGRDGNVKQRYDQGERARSWRAGEPGYAASVRAAQRAPSAWPAVWLRSGAVWRLLGAAGREGDPLVRDPGRGCEREEHHYLGRAAGIVGGAAR